MRLEKRQDESYYWKSHCYRSTKRVFVFVFVILVYKFYSIFIYNLIHCAVFEQLKHISSVFHASCSLNNISVIQRAWYHMQLTVFSLSTYVDLSIPLDLSNISQSVILHVGHEEGCKIVYVDLIPELWMCALNTSQGVIPHVGHEEGCKIVYVDLIPRLWYIWPRVVHRSHQNPGPVNSGTKRRESMAFWTPEGGPLMHSKRATQGMIFIYL